MDKDLENIELSIITVNYGSADFIKKLWLSLQKAGVKNFELIVVDNNSPRNNVKKLGFLDKEKNAHVIRLSKNIGFGEGNNEGVKFSRGKIIAIVNPDIELVENPFPLLIKGLKNNGLVVPQLLSPTGELQDNARPFPSWFKLIIRRIFYHTKKATIFTKDSYIDWAQGSFLVTTKDNFLKVGGFDSRYFLFLEDADLCRKYWEKGLTISIIPKATAQHKVERLSGGNFWQACRKKTFWIHIVSAFKYFWKWRGHKLPKLLKQKKQ